MGTLTTRAGRDHLRLVNRGEDAAHELELRAIDAGTGADYSFLFAPYPMELAPGAQLLVAIDAGGPPELRLEAHWTDNARRPGYLWLGLSRASGGSSPA